MSPTYLLVYPLSYPLLFIYSLPIYYKPILFESFELLPSVHYLNPVYWNTDKIHGIGSLALYKFG